VPLESVQRHPGETPSFSVISLIIASAQDPTHQPGLLALAAAHHQIMSLVALTTAVRCVCMVCAYDCTHACMQLFAPYAVCLWTLSELRSLACMRQAVRGPGACMN
jgi:hypothetical protein